MVPSTARITPVMNKRLYNDPKLGLHTYGIQMTLNLN